MASLLEQIFAQQTQQPAPQVPEISSTGETLGNILALAANAAGAVTGQGAMGRPFQQFAQQSGQRAAQRAALQQRGITEQRLQRQQQIDLAKSIGSEARAEAREGRASSKRKRAETLQQELANPKSQLYNAIDDDTTRLLLTTMDPEKAQDTLAAIFKGKVASKRQQKALQEAQQLKAKMVLLKKNMDAQKLTRFERAQQALAADPKLKPEVALASQGFSAKEIENFLDMDELSASLGIPRSTWWGGTGESTRGDLERQVQAAQQRQSGAEAQFLAGAQQGAQPAQQQQVINPQLQQQAIQLLQQQGRAVTPETIAIVIQRLQQR